MTVTASDALASTTPRAIGPGDTERAQVLQELRAHGWNATSFQVLEPGFRYFFDQTDGVVAYVDTGRAWVAAGAPIAPEARIAEVAQAFELAAGKAGRRCLFFAVESRFLANARFSALPVGEQPVWDPTEWSETVRGARSLREQIRRARAKGVRVRPLSADDVRDPDGAARLGIDALVARWIASRPMAQMGFLVALHPFSYVAERRYFLAEIDGRVVGFLAIVPVYARGGWFFEDLLRDPYAPNGTAESLVDHAMRALSAEGSHYATLGLAPLAGEMPGALRAARALGTPLYDFRGLRAFKGKLRPTRWDPILLAYPEGDGPILAIVDTLTAFARGGLVGFGVQTLFRVPTAVVQLLAILLVPWTALLAMAPTSRWFPHVGVKIAWVAFDLLLFAGMWRLASRWRQSLATLLATAITLDAAVTLVEAVVFNAPRARTPWEASVVVTAVLAPALAAAALWRARQLRSRWM